MTRFGDAPVVHKPVVHKDALLQGKRKPSMSRSGQSAALIRRRGKQGRERPQSRVRRPRARMNPSLRLRQVLSRGAA